MVLTGVDDAATMTGLSGGPPTTPLPPAATLPAGVTFAGRYTIIKPLGAGGMAAVYQAWDEILGIAVALKLIRADETIHPLELQDLQARFKQELKLARQISHPNVIRIHDLGEVGKTLYITMALVQGSDLAHTLRQGRPPVARALTFARQIASGLKAVHDAGIVHRDLKPANILIDGEDRAFLTDFGIARSTNGGTLHTMPGALVGTLEYMAPEQARGEPVTERTDIYSFGLILYELLAGGRPRRAGTGGLEDLIARIETGPPALGTVTTDVAADLEQIVARCLERDPAKRYQTTAELLADLEALDDQGRRRLGAIGQARWKKVVAATLTAAALVGATWWTAARFATPPSVPAPRDPVTVLIADFDNRSSNPVFTGALEQALSVAMEGASFISAYPRTEAARLTSGATTAPGRLTDENARLVALREGIHVVLAGSIDRSGDGFQLSLRQLAPDGELITSVTEPASSPTEVLTAIGKLAEKIRRALGDQTPSEQVLAETVTAANFEAVRAYTTAQQLSQDQKDEEAVEHYRRAIAADKDFGRAYSGLAASLSDLGRKKEAEAMWAEALKRTGGMTPRESLRTLGGYYMQVANDYPKAIEKYTELVQKYPADSAGHNNLGVALFNQLDFAGALREGSKAIEVYPRSFKYRSNYALYAMYAGDVNTSTSTAQQLLKEDPAFASAYLPLAMSALMNDDVAAARRSYENAAAAAGYEGQSLAAIGLADIAILVGRPAEAIAQLPAAIKADLEKRDDFNAVAKSLALAEAQAASGDTRAAAATLADARQTSDEDKVLVTQAMLAIKVNRLDDARTVALELGKRLPAHSRAYARLVEAEVARASGNHGDALDALAKGIALADLWPLRYARGLVYLHAGPTYAPQALDELTLCDKRIGEATAAFLDDLPTYRYAAELPYWIGRAKEAVNQDARPSYEKYVARRQGASNDRLLEDARRRLAGGSR